MDLLEVFWWMINLKSDFLCYMHIRSWSLQTEWHMLLSLVQSECENEFSFNHLIVPNVSICVYKKNSE